MSERNSVRLYGEYAKRAGSALCSATFVCDHAISAEKMTSWSCVGVDNLAWTEGPFLSPGANKPQIDRSRPYCLKTSLETSVACQLVLGESPDTGANGGVKLPIEPSEANTWLSERLVAKLVIIEQFELFRDFALSVDGPHNKKSSEIWRARIGDTLLGKLQELANRRNELTHDGPVSPPTMKEAVECFNSLRWIASSVAQTLRC